MSATRPGDLHAALAAVARAIAESLEVRDVWDRVADACHTIVPFDAMGIVRLEEGGQVRAVAAAGEPAVKALEGQVYPRAGFSPAFWPNADEFMVLLGDVPNQLDAAYPVDRIAIEWGYRSVLRVPLGHSGERLGSIPLASRTPECFTKAHGGALVVIAEMAALALAHERLAATLAEETRRTVAAHERAERLEQRVQALAQELQSLSPHQVLGISRRWRDVLAQAAKVAATDTTVLLTGESGSGKEVVARFIHRGSPRKDGPFVALNCAALPEQLLESELFGHERGAFTGAQATRPGRIEQAAGGVLFLDEVTEMSPGVQAKFLRVLQEREYQRLGGARTLRADVRVLAASNRDLRQAIARGTFREDLYYRLAVFDIELPPLRERADDIPLMVDAFLEEVGRHVGRPAAGITAEAKQRLGGYAWPGNVRELRNVIERAVILSEGGLITIEHLPLTMSAIPAGQAEPMAPQSLPDTEREMIAQALARCGDNKSKAARILGLTRAQLRSRIDKYGLNTKA
ncbi:sigma-54-dependent Fis family transcriptional regulator [Lysobacter niastensis]|uniref:Sigma 54-interacting transcriptional regulator n=1 Tax=Lysobacter niastensis TaxID=380629 RepID=A0ABS0B395_9GAMM|nr:sigma 54-interacting transcriptional regulator [Lysobacter niastensis]MBF6022951.1 sigma 54-interacting transcriptional regulator [Lysobacter niastensis]